MLPSSLLHMIYPSQATAAQRVSRQRPNHPTYLHRLSFLGPHLKTYLSSETRMVASNLWLP